MLTRGPPFPVSVATTSTKSPYLIKQDIKRVLDRMQIQYRETKTGFECIHMPSIDINSVVESTPSQRGHQKQGSSGSAETETTRKSIARKSSKLSFGKKSRDREKGPDTKEKELPSRPSGGTVLSMTPSSASSSFFHVSSNAHGPVEAARSDTLEATTSHGEDPARRSPSPTASKILPPIPRDFAPAPLSAQPFPTGQVDNDLFESIGSSSLSVRFDINIVKVCSFASV